MTARLDDLCRELQLDVPQLAARAQLEPERVLAIVAGRWTPSPEERQQIARAVEREPEEIAWGHLTPIQHLWGHGSS